MKMTRASRYPKTATETLARVSHLYFVLGLTQGEIATRLSMTRFKVHRLLTRARESGMVRIEIDVPFTGRLLLESELAQKHGLGAAFVCPSDATKDTPLDSVIGQYASLVVADMLRDGSMIATSWGATLRALASAIEPHAAQRLAVVAMIGSLATRSTQDKYDASSVLAERLGAECFYLSGPMLCDSPQARKTFENQPVVQQAMERAGNADIALLSVGGTQMHSIRKAGILSAEDFENVVKAGAIGNFLGRFIDAEGRVLDHPLNRLCLGIGPEAIFNIKQRILCAGGTSKLPAIRAILVRRAATILVTDENTARALL